VYAQDEPEAAGQPEAVQSPTEGEQPEGSEVRAGAAKGAYWWAEVDPASLAAFAEFGIDVVAFRFGRAARGEARMGGDGSAGAAAGVTWASGGDFAALASLPPSLGYRLVIESEADLWRGGRESMLAEWLTQSVAPQAVQAQANVRGMEILLPGTLAESESTPGVEVLGSILQELRDSSPPIPIEIGLNAAFLGELSPQETEDLVRLVDGLVVYFADYDFDSMSPRITDRPWIDATSAELTRLGVAFTAVFPVYNRALRYPGGGSRRAEVLAAVDLEALRASSDVRPMGAAGTEYVLTSELGIPGARVSVGDRIRVLESLKEVDLEGLISELPGMAPDCREIDLFRFPLVPGFDPTPGEVLTAAGWLARPPETAADIGELEKEQLDQKHGQAQQMIWMVTLALMMVVLMRMFSRGAGQQKQQGK